MKWCLLLKRNRLTLSLIQLSFRDMNTPLSYKTQLASNPKPEPQYSTDIKLSSGTVKAADTRAVRALISLMDMQAGLGGAASHFGGPSAFAELMSALHAIIFTESEKAGVQWFDKFHFVNDAGHCENGLYALKALYGFADLTVESLKGFRSLNSNLSGHGEAHLFPEGVWVSNGPLGSGLPQAQGLGLADALSGKDRLTVCAISDGGCMEGEAREAFAAIPGLASKGKMSPFVMIISDNNTKLTGRIDEDSFSMAPSFAGLSDMGWNVIKLEDGHNLQDCASTIEKAFVEARKNPNKPVAIHAKTIKGYGTEKTAESSSGAHGFPLKKPAELSAFLTEIYGGEELPQEFTAWMNSMIEEEANKKKSAPSDIKTEKVQVGISSAMIKAQKKGLPVLSISADLPGSTGVASFQKECPEASQDLGVAEANMVSTAIGLSKCGYIPVVDTFSQFGVTKGGLPLIMSALSQGPVICVFSHAGFQDAADGASHQALSFLAMTGSIPHTDVYYLTCSEEAEALMTQAIEDFADQRGKGKTPNTTVFFLGRENFPQNYLGEGTKYKLGEAQVVFDNTIDQDGKATIVATGPLLHQALEAAYTLEKEGIGSIVVNPSIINKPDLSTIQTCLRNTDGNLVTVDDHQIIGGMGAMLTHALCRQNIPFNLKSLGVNGEFGQSSYTAIGLYKKHKMDAGSIADAVRSFS